MTDNSNEINLLLEKLNTLLKKQNDFSEEINNLRIEINQLKDAGTARMGREGEVRPGNTAAIEFPETPKENVVPRFENPREPVQQKPPLKPLASIHTPPKVKTDLEKLIGENLISKIGIAITIIGVAVGAKYAIDHQLISPLTRIVLGYLVGLALIGFAIKLKKKYENFSAVLLSGAMAILYFITYAAYSFYGLIPQMLTFALMVVFTAFTVVAALHYNRQVIAQIGLVGAYAVPFLLSDGSGNVTVLFTYMAIINTGILFIAFKKYWKPLYYSAFGLTWLIYVFWFAFKYVTSQHLGLALTFLAIFFALFYATTLAYKLVKKEKFTFPDVVLLLINSFIFYGIGYALLSDHETTSQLLGLFTLLNAIVHFVVSTVIYRQKLADRNLFYMVSGLVLTFITIAIPVQLDGNWVTLLWAGEAALLFWIGRTKTVPVYEKLSYLLMILAFFSILHDWSSVYFSYYPEDPETRIVPLFNIYFLSSLLFVLAFAFINVLNQNKRYASAFTSQKIISKAIDFFVPGILLFSLYYTFRIEIETYWNQLFTDSLVKIPAESSQYADSMFNFDLNRFKIIWVINYSLLFVSALAWFNFKKIKSRQLTLVNMGLIILVLLVFLGQGLYALSELRESYLEQPPSPYYKSGPFHIGIRYISFAFVALALMACYRYIRPYFMHKNFNIAIDLLVHATVLWVASSELINWMDIGASTQSYKLGLSILWGMYALFLIALGIWKKKKHLRIGAIALFGATLVKLFFYDISHLDTVSKTIVLVSLGVLLLIISFLYNKYKHIIADEIVS